MCEAAKKIDKRDDTKPKYGMNKYGAAESE